MLQTQRPYGFIMGGNGSVLAASAVCILVVTAWTLGELLPCLPCLPHLPAGRLDWHVCMQAPGRAGVHALIAACLLAHASGLGTKLP